MKNFIAIILAIFLSCAASFAVELNVTDYGAIGDGKTDNTAAFQKALDAACKSGGGKVRVPAGMFLISRHLTISYNTSLVGEWEAPPAPTKIDPATMQVDMGIDAKKAIIAGSVLLATEGAGDENGVPFISMDRNATIKGIIIYYPNQIFDTKPVAYPWTIRGSGDNISIVDCLFINPYMAVDFGTIPCGRHYIRGLYAQAIYKGLFIDKCYDVGRVENIHFFPFWSAHMLTGPDAYKICDWMARNSTAFILSRSDWEYISNCFSYSYHQGFHFKSTGPDGPGNYLLTQTGADGCDIAANFEELQGHSGVSFSNAQFFGRILVDPKNNGMIKFSSCGFFGAAIKKDKPDTEVIRIDGQARVSFDNCHFYAIDGRTATPVFFRQVGGRLSVNNSLYIVNPTLDPIPLVIEKGAISTIYAQNEHYTCKRVVNNKGKSGRIIIKDNIYGDTK
ncbi:MAG: glycosyl hydrolase family 28-related protein [Armatimonadota bacterium]